MAEYIDPQLLAAVAPKTDQLNADNLIGIDSLVVTIKGPCTRGGDGKIHIPLEECKPFKPCAGQGRILLQIYGNWDKWPGKKIRIFRNPDVTYGGVACGGIEISELSHIERMMEVPVRKNRNKVVIQKIYPLKEEKDQVLNVQVAFRQAVTEDEVKKAMQMATSFTDDQKRRLANDYNAAIKRVAKSAE